MTFRQQRVAFFELTGRHRRHEQRGGGFSVVPRLRRILYGYNYAEVNSQTHLSARPPHVTETALTFKNLHSQYLHNKTDNAVATIKQKRKS